MFGREELADQVAVRTVDLHACEPYFFGDGGGACKARNQFFDLCVGEFFGGCKERAHIFGKGNGGGRVSYAIQRADGLFAWVVDLHPERGVVLAAGLRPSTEERRGGR